MSRTVINNGDSGATVRAALNTMTGDLYTIARASFGGVRPTIGFAGDSKGANDGGLTGVSALRWALWRDYAADLLWDERDYASGGMMFAVGGTTTAQMVSTQIPQIQARTPNILWVEPCNNDAMTVAADVAAPYNNTITTITAAFAAGVQLIILVPCAPRSSSVLTATNVKLYMMLNEKLRAYARNNANVVFIDNPPLLTDPAYADYRPLGDGGVTGTNQRPYGAMSSDGLHQSINTARATAPLLTNALKAVCRERFPRVVSQGDVYDATNNPNGNQLGSKGMFAGTNGTLNAVANAGVAANWGMTTSNGLVATPTLVTGTTGRLAGFPVQQIVLSGTTTANDARCDLVATGVYQDWPVGTSFMAEVIIRVVNPGNILVPSMIVGAINDITTIGSSGTSGPNNLMPNTIDETYFMYTTRASTPRPTSGNTNPSMTIRLNVPTSGMVASGTYQIGLCGLFAVAP